MSNDKFRVRNAAVQLHDESMERDNEKRQDTISTDTEVKAE